MIAAGQRRAGPAEREHDAEMVARARRRPARACRRSAAADSRSRPAAAPAADAPARRPATCPRSRAAPAATPAAMPSGSADQRRDRGDPQRQLDRASIRLAMSSNTRGSGRQGCTRNVKPCFSKMALAADGAQEGQIAGGFGFRASRCRHRIDDRRVAVRREGADDLHAGFDLGVGRSRRCRAAPRRARPTPARRARSRPSRISARPPSRRRAFPAPPWRICRPARP